MSTIARLPRGIRLAAVLVAIIAGLESLFSLQELLNLLWRDSSQQALQSASDARSAVELATLSLADQYERSLGPVRGFRMLTLATLWVSGFIAFTAAVRLLRPEGLLRTDVRPRLARMTVITAILSAVDGAQKLALLRSLRGAHHALDLAVAESFLKAMEMGGSAEQFASWMTAGRFALFVGTTVVSAGGLLALGQFFNSARVREAVALQDRTPERPRPHGPA